MASILFCLKCASHLIDVVGWSEDGTSARLRCCDCGHEITLEGFTVGRLAPSAMPYAQAELVAVAAADDAALFRGWPTEKRQRFHAQAEERARARVGLQVRRKV